MDPDPVTGTLRGFEKRFSAGDLFRSASEICDVFLVPKLLPNMKYAPGIPAPASYDNITSWWKSMSLSGDNARENPYNDLYPRLTTKSNTYQIHLRVQTLQKLPHSDAATWTEARDQVTAEYRGSFILERYVDANDTTLPDFATHRPISARSRPILQIPHHRSQAIHSVVIHNPKTHQSRPSDPSDENL
ncbi:MAG: hypothetical protein WDN28_21345 [Chthoniobacter sp.]